MQIENYNLIDVPDGCVAAVVTYLEMAAKPDVRAGQGLPESCHLQPANGIALNDYRQWYRDIGGPWLWTSRLLLDDDALEAILRAPTTRLYALMMRGQRVGMLELDESNPDETELAFFGLLPGMTGQGLGRSLMHEALHLAWARPGLQRLWVHTCTLDDPRALGFYQRCGFTPYARKLEWFPDPRLKGIHAEDSAPSIPLI